MRLPQTCPALAPPPPGPPHPPAPPGAAEPAPEDRAGRGSTSYAGLFWSEVVFEVQRVTWPARSDVAGGVAATVLLLAGCTGGVALLNGCAAALVRLLSSI